MCCSSRPLRWGELACMLTMDWADQGDKNERRLFKSAILEACNPLVEYLSENDVFRLLHTSMRDFLLNLSTSNQPGTERTMLHFQEIDGHSELADLCLTYILDLPIDLGI